MHRAFIRTLMAILAVVMAAGPAMAQTYTTNFDKGLKCTNLTVTGTLTQTGSETVVGNSTRTGNLAQTGNITLTGNQTISGTLGVTGAATFSTPLTNANLGNSSKVILLTIPLSPPSAACVDSTVYRGTIFPGRAGTVKKITFGCQTAPTVGTDTLKVLKGSSSGNTMLSTATVDANTLVANTATTATLTGTSADLSITATQPIYAEYSAGVQTVDAIGVTATIELELTDY